MEEYDKDPEGHNHSKPLTQNHYINAPIKLVDVTILIGNWYFHK